jgi:hypothetical protein
MSIRVFLASGPSGARALRRVVRSLSPVLIGASLLSAGCAAGLRPVAALRTPLPDRLVFRFKDGVSFAPADSATTEALHGRYASGRDATERDASTLPRPDSLPVLTARELGPARREGGAPASSEPPTEAVIACDLSRSYDRGFYQPGFETSSGAYIGGFFPGARSSWAHNLQSDVLAHPVLVDSTSVLLLVPPQARTAKGWIVSPFGLEFFVRDSTLDGLPDPGSFYAHPGYARVIPPLLVYVPDRLLAGYRASEDTSAVRWEDPVLADPPRALRPLQLVDSWTAAEADSLSEGNREQFLRSMQSLTAPQRWIFRVAQDSSLVDSALIALAEQARREKDSERGYTHSAYIWCDLSRALLMLLKGGEEEEAAAQISAFLHALYFPDKSFDGSARRFAAKDPNYAPFLERYGDRVAGRWDRITGPRPPVSS